METYDLEDAMMNGTIKENGEREVTMLEIDRTNTKISYYDCHGDDRLTPGRLDKDGQKAVFSDSVQAPCTRRPYARLFSRL